MTNVRPRRSALYLPASNARAIEKAKQLACDVVILDLEDAVSPEAKPDAREQACRAVQERGFGSRELVVRINGVGTAWFQQDIEQVAQARPDAVLLPKVEDPTQIQAVVRVLESVEAARDVAVWCMLETPRGVLASNAIAGAHQRVDCLVMGTSDLTADLRARHTPERFPLFASLGLCVLAARANGKAVLDGVFLDLSNESAFQAVCKQGRQFGFDGKTLIHPRQIDACNAEFSPTNFEIEEARRIITAYSTARTEGRGIAVLNGQLVEELHVREAQRTLSLANTVGSGDSSGS